MTTLTRAKERRAKAVSSKMAEGIKLAIHPAKDSLLEYIKFVDPDWNEAPHLILIVRALEAVERFIRGEAPAYVGPDAIEKLQAGEKIGLQRLIIQMPPQHGKALHVDTPIPTPSGWSRIADLKPGDVVFDEGGSPTKIVAVSSVWKDRPLYRVQSDDGVSILADESHKWVVRLCRKRKVISQRTTRYLYDRQLRNKDDRAPMVLPHKAIQLPGCELPIHPYVLGIWLGDGRSDGASITTGDQEIYERVTEIEGEGTVYNSPGSCFTFRPGKSCRDGKTREETLSARLKALGLYEGKRIPDLYLRASKDQRLALLQGLIDSDGYVSPAGQVEFCSTLEGLAGDVRELVWSLGYKAMLYEGRATLDGRDCGPKYRVCFYMKGAAFLPRKADRCRDASRCAGRYLRITPEGRGDTVCIQVSSESGMFLAGRGYLATHNSELVSRKFPAYFVGRNSEKKMILASYEKSLALSMSRAARENFRTYSSALWNLYIDPEASGAGEWELDGHSGGLVAAGCQGSIPGRRADLFLVDDYVKGLKEAESPAVQKSLRDWFRGTVRTRLSPRSALVMVGTWWAAGDVFNTLFEEMEGGGEQWVVIRFQGLYDVEEEEKFAVRFPSIANKKDPLGRKDGDPLWPWKYENEGVDAKEALLVEKRALGRLWSGLWQQNPEGDIVGALWDIKEMVDPYRTKIIPNVEKLVIGVDPAGSEANEVGIVVASCSWVWDPNERASLLNGYVLEDLSGVYGDDPEKWARIVIEAYEDYGADAIVAEKNYGGAMVDSNISIVAKMLGKRVFIQPDVNATMGKRLRADPIASLYRLGLVHHLTGKDLSDLEKELRTWVPPPLGSGWSPNRLDALVWALTYLLLDGQQGGGPGILSAMGLVQRKGDQRRRR